MEEGQVAEEKEEEQEMLHGFGGRTIRLPTQTIRHEVPETSLPKIKAGERSPLTVRPALCPAIGRTVRVATRTVQPL